VVTIYDIAKKANVSPMTVSRVINQSPLISHETRRKVEEAIKELDYIPNKMARSLVSNRTKLVGLAVPDITNPFFTKLTRGAEDKAMQAGYQLILGNTDENLDKESKYMDLFLSTGVDGVLIVAVEDASLANLRKLAKRNVPFVLADRHIDGIATDLVQGDNADTVRLLVRHLLDRGHRRIALFNGPGSLSNARERKAAFRESLASAGLECSPRLMLETHFKVDNMKDIVANLLSLSGTDRPTAIVAANNFIGVNTVRALRELNIPVPEAIAVVCFDDPEPIPDYNPFLTVAAQPAYDLGYIGMQLLIERMEGHAPKQPRKIVLPSALVIRKSTELFLK
jgi:LacI family transcriptional regulator